LNLNTTTWRTVPAGGVAVTGRAAGTVLQAAVARATRQVSRVVRMIAGGEGDRKEARDEARRISRATSARAGAVTRRPTQSTARPVKQEWRTNLGAPFRRQESPLNRLIDSDWRRVHMC
jgi:hypothetical protein